ncbi:hypothetical protein EKK58_06370 [Candidatus Dependentiae bacterium]|nr:MAG: hypothetical protein EKK58_06370 [Candidatus Dependentiae bacterium]
MKHLSKFIVAYYVFTISITYSMSLQLLYDGACGITNFVVNKYTDAYRYAEKNTNPELIDAILGIKPNKKEEIKNKKVYLEITKYIETLQKSDMYPQGLSLNNYYIANKENVRIALRRGPLAAGYLIDKERDFDPYKKLSVSNTLLKQHAASFLYGLYLIIAIGNNGQIEMKKKFLDHDAPIVSNTKLSLLHIVVRYLIEETRTMNTDLLFELPNKTNLDQLITQLTTIREALPT